MSTTEDEITSTPAKRNSTHNQAAKLIAVFIGGSMYLAMLAHQALNVEPEFYVSRIDRRALAQQGRALQAQLDALANAGEAESLGRRQSQKIRLTAG